MSVIKDKDFETCSAVKDVLKQLSDEEVIEIYQEYFDKNYGLGSFWQNDFYGNLALIKEDLLARDGIFKDYSENEIKEIINNEESSFNPKDKWLLYEETMLSDGRENAYINTYPTALDAIWSKNEPYVFNEFLSKSDYKDNSDCSRLIESIVYDNNDYGNVKIRECLDNFNKSYSKDKKVKTK